jgi:hypothetical protein
MLGSLAAAALIVGLAIWAVTAKIGPGGIEDPEAAEERAEEAEEAREEAAEEARREDRRGRRGGRGR